MPEVETGHDGNHMMSPTASEKRASEQLLSPSNAALLGVGGTTAVAKSVRNRRNREYKEDYEGVYLQLLEELGLSTVAAAGASLVEQHSKTLSKLRELLNGDTSKVDDYIAVFKDSRRPLLQSTVFYMEMVIKHTLFCKQVVAGGQEVQLHTATIDVIRFAKEYDQRRSKYPDYHVEMILGWWFALYIHILAIVQTNSANREEAKFVQNASEYLTQQSAIALLLLAGVYLYDKALCRSLGLSERERERDRERGERDRSNSVSGVPPDDSTVRDKSRKITQSTRKRLRSAHKYLKLLADKGLPGFEGSENDPDSIRSMLALAYKKASWTSVVKLQRAYPPLSTVVTCFVKSIPAHTCRQLLGIDRVSDSRFADRGVIATDPNKLHASATTMDDISIADSEPSSDSKLTLLLAKLFRLEKFVTWLREKWPSGVDEGFILSTESKSYLVRQIFLLSWLFQSADLREGVPFHNPEAFECWVEFREAMQHFLSFLASAARRGFANEAVLEQLNLLLVQIRFFAIKLVELQSFEACIVD